MAKTSRCRGTLVALLGLATAFGLSACQSTVEGIDHAPAPVTLVVSESWVRNHQDGAGGEDAQARLRSLRAAIDRLRRETHGGWTGRQDDVTGYLAELSGGSWPGEPRGFMDEYGSELFGVDGSTLLFDAPDTDTVPGVTTTRASQAVGEVPVLDASLVFTGRGTTADELRVSGVRGRVFPGLAVSTTPTLTAEQASAVAAQAGGGTADGAPRLVVIASGAGILAWEVTVVSPALDTTAAGRYYVDATTGSIVDVRPVGADVVTPSPAASLRSTTSQREPDPNSVQVSGKDPLGRDLTAYGLQTGQGVELTDTTTEAWDSSTRTGAVQTYDASGARNESQLPGRLLVSRTTTVRDADAIAAQAYSHAIVDYYESLGRDSWDDDGGQLVSSVHFGPDNFCNAFFADYLNPPQMVYGNPCVLGGQRLNGTFVEPDIAAHEVTHGVTDTTAGLIYSGQSGALNEAFSDYFGNVIGNLIHDNDSVAMGEDSCQGVQPNQLCVTNPDGSVSFRYMLNGNDFDDYLRILTTGTRLRLLINYNQDNGGVHSNSAIWNNALWTIRSRLAQIDGQPGNTSKLARSFDRAVYGALASRLTPTSGFVDARAAVEQVIIDSGLEPVVLRTAREVFDAVKICTGCPDTGELAGDSVNNSPQTQLHPSISGDRVLWLDLSSGTDYSGYAASTSLGSSGAPALSTAEAMDVAFAGDAYIAIDVNGRLTRTDPSGATTLLDRVGSIQSVAAGLGGSDAGAAWLSQGSTVKYVDAGGTVFQADVQGLQGDTIDSIGAGGGTVAFGTDQGRVFVWTPGSGKPRQIGTMPGAVLSITTYGGPVFAIDDSHLSKLFTADGRVAQVTTLAAPFGATMSAEYVVWAEATGPIESGVVAGGRSPYPETDLYLLSLGTGQIYNLHSAPAQQGFPSISGRQLVWQDAAFGGDDVFTARIPANL